MVIHHLLRSKLAYWCSWVVHWTLCLLINATHHPLNFPFMYSCVWMVCQTISWLTRTLPFDSPFAHLTITSHLFIFHGEHKWRYVEHAHKWVCQSVALRSHTLLHCLAQLLSVVPCWNLKEAHFQCHVQSRGQVCWHYTGVGTHICWIPGGPLAVTS